MSTALRRGCVNSDVSPLPPPLVPPEVDLRGLEWMPYYGDRVMRSAFNAQATDAEWRAGHNLWWSAWNNVPAASLPNDDAALARYADMGRDVRGFRRIKGVAMHGFVLCSDNRYYHPFMAELAIPAWGRRVRERARKARWRGGQDAPDDAPETGTERAQDAPGDGDAAGLDRHADFAGLSWRVNRGPASWGVWEEYPVLSDGRGLGDVWDEVSPKWGARPPTFSELVNVDKSVLCIIDIAIQHKGQIVFAIEVVHKHPSTLSKVNFLRDRLTLLEIPAYWILGQVDRPTSIPPEFFVQ